MSAESLAIALHHSRAKGTAKIVMLGIANHDGDGGAWPSVRTLAKYANVDERNVQRAIDQLIRLGEIERFVGVGGNHLTPDHRRPSLYRVRLMCPPTCDRTAQHRTAKYEPRQLPIAELAALSTGVTIPPPLDPQSSHGVTIPPPVGVAQASPEPSRELATHLPETKPSVRARATWPDTTCPGNWREQRHELGVNGKCRHCHEAPMLVDPVTGELAS